MAHNAIVSFGSGHPIKADSSPLGEPVDFDIRGVGRRLPPTEAPDGWVRKIVRSREGKVWVGFFHLWTTDARPDAANAAAEPGPRPNPEVVAKAKRRRFTGEYKRRILIEADAAKTTGDIGSLLRREQLYSSHLVTWRRERNAGILQGLSPSKPGPKSKQHPFDAQLQQLHRQNARLTEDLRKANIIIDVQKKLATLLETLASQEAAGKSA